MPRYSRLDDEGFVARLKDSFHNAAACTQELAGVMEISKKSCQRYLNKLNLHYKKGRPKGTKSKNKLTGGLASWIRNNPGEILPSHPVEIAAKTGLTLDQIKCFLYRMRKKRRQLIAALGDLREYKGGIRGNRGTLIRFSDIKNYSIVYSPYNDNLKIHATLKTKEKIAFETTFSILEKYKSEGVNSKPPNHPYTEHP